MNTSPPDMPEENRLDSDAFDHATETQRAVREGRRHSDQPMQREPDGSRHAQNRQPEPPWQID